MFVSRGEVWNMFSVSGNWCKEELCEHDSYKDWGYYAKSRASIMGKSWITSIQHPTNKWEFRSIIIPKDEISYCEVVTCYCNQVFNFYIVFFKCLILFHSTTKFYCTVNESVNFKSNSYFFCSCSPENIYSSWSVSMRI